MTVLEVRLNADEAVGRTVVTGVVAGAVVAGAVVAGGVVAGAVVAGGVAGGVVAPSEVGCFKPDYIQSPCFLSSLL